jgi:hypothetical protein
VKKSAGTSPTTSATWEDIDSFIDRSPTFQLEDELLVKGGGDVMWGANIKGAPGLETQPGQPPRGHQW